MKIKTSQRKLFYWMQEPKEEKDDELCKKVNELLNNPPPPSSGGRAADGALGDLGSALSDPELANILNGMSPQQLLQMLGGGGGGSLAQLLGPASGSSASRSSSNAGASSNARTPSQSGTTTTTAATPTPSPASGTSASVTPAAPSSTPSGQGNTASGQAAIQLSDLQNIIAGLTVPGQSADAQRNRSEVPIDLSSSITAEVLRPLLTNEDFMKRVRDHLPKTDEGADQKASEQQATDQTREQFTATVSSPQFQQALSIFSAALESGQLGPLISQFGLPESCVVAASNGGKKELSHEMCISRISFRETDIGFIFSLVKIWKHLFGPFKNRKTRIKKIIRVDNLHPNQMQPRRRSHRKRMMTMEWP